MALAAHVVGECKNPSCNFIHRKNVEAWDEAPIMDRREARLLIQKASATRGLRGLSTERNAKRRQSLSRPASPSNSAPEEPAVRELGEEKKEAKTSSSSSSSYSEHGLLVIMS